MTTTDQSPKHLKALAQEVSRVSGLDVTCTRDCEVLSEELHAFDSRFANGEHIDPEKVFWAGSETREVLDKHVEHPFSVCGLCLLPRLGSAPSHVCMANMHQLAAVTQYHGLKRRILELVAKHHP